MQERKQLLQNLILYHHPEQLSQIQEALSMYGWDSDEILVTLTREDVVNILQRYQNKEIDAQQVADWAWALEGREDLAYETYDDSDETLFFVVADLANPEMEGSLTPEKSLAMIDVLREKVSASQKSRHDT